MFFQSLVVGDIMTNCYILGDNKSKEAVIIDPGGDAKLILSILKERDYCLKYIINTHGHADHIAGNQIIADSTGAKILVHENDANMLGDSLLNLSSFLGHEITSKYDITLKEGDVIEMEWLKLKVIHTSGHTLGGICLLADDFIFTGDTLFASGIGRTDFPGGSYKTIIESITKKLLVLDKTLTIYPGHGEHSTIGNECQRF